MVQGMLNDLNLVGGDKDGEAEHVDPCKPDHTMKSNCQTLEVKVPELS